MAGGAVGLTSCVPANTAVRRSPSLRQLVLGTGSRAQHSPIVRGQPLADRVLGQLGDGTQVELLHDLVPMGLDGRQGDCAGPSRSPWMTSLRRPAAVPPVPGSSATSVRGRTRTARGWPRRRRPGLSWGSGTSRRERRLSARSAGPRNASARSPGRWPNVSLKRLKWLTSSISSDSSAPERWRCANSRFRRSTKYRRLCRRVRPS